MYNVPEIFGSLVFGDRTMRERLPKETYQGVAAHSGRGKKAGYRYCKRRRQRYEGLGGGEGGHPFYPLVPAHDRHHRGEARQLYVTGRATAR